MDYYFPAIIAGWCVGCINKIVGAGYSMLILPAIAYAYGPDQALPLAAVAVIMGNIEKIWSWWRDMDWQAAASYALPGVPAALLATLGLLALPTEVVEAGMGALLLALIPLRRWGLRKTRQLKAWQLSALGAVLGSLSGLAMALNPAGLASWAWQGAQTAALVLAQAAPGLPAKLGQIWPWEQLAGLPLHKLGQGVLAGSSLWAGSWAGKLVTARMPQKMLQRTLDTLILGGGLSMFWAAWR